MAEEKKGKDKINTLCKKLFRPDLCEEPVTESKEALQKKLLAQLIRYGDWIVAKKIKENEYIDFSMVVLDTIEKCMEKWREGIESTAFSTYFYNAVLQNCLNEIKLKDNQNISVYGANDDEDTPLYDMREDQKNLSAEKKLVEEDTVLNALKVIDRFYRLKESKEHKDWLGPLLTCELYEGLHDFSNKFGGAGLKKLKFVDYAIYNLNKKLTRKQVAERYGVTDSYLCKEIQRFFEPVKDELNNSILNPL